MHHLSTIGILIHHYRKKQNIKAKQFIIDFDNESEICSLRTLNGIEKGKVHTFDYIDLLCKKINKKILSDEHLLNKIDQLSESIIHALEEMSVTEMNKIHKELEFFNVKEEYIYFYECGLLFKDIINYHLFNDIPKIDNVAIYKDMVITNNQNLRRLIIFFLYTLSNINTMNINRDEIIKLCDEYLDDPLLFNRYLTSIYSQNSLFSAYNIFNEMSNNDNLNFYQQTYLKYLMSFCLLNAGEPKEAYEILKNVLDKMPKHYFTNDLEVRFYTSLAICAYSIKEYEVVVENFEKAFDSNYLKINYNFLTYFYCLEKLNKYEEIYNLCERIDILAIPNKTVQSIIQYYRLKHQPNINDLSKYSIMEKILFDSLEHLKKFGDGYTTIINSEMIKVCKKTGNYKALANLLK